MTALLVGEQNGEDGAKSLPNTARAQVKQKWPQPPRFPIPSLWLVLAAIAVIVIVVNLLGIARHR